MLTGHVESVSGTLRYLPQYESDNRYVCVCVCGCARAHVGVCACQCLRARVCVCEWVGGQAFNARAVTLAAAQLRMTIGSSTLHQSNVEVKSRRYFRVLRWIFLKLLSSDGCFFF